jgi:hypothetical protein
VAVLGAPVLVQDKARRGGNQLQLFLRIAKSRAIADGAPRGIRIIMDADGFARQVQATEQPSDFIVMLPGAAGIAPQPRGITVGPGANQVMLLGASAPGVSDFTGGIDVTTPADDPSWPVQGDKNIGGIILTGDYLELQGGGLLHRITSVTASTLTLASTPPNLAATGTTQWRVLRQPRVLKGETPLLLPQDVVIDVSKSYPPPSAAGSADILFAPSGRVLGALGAQDRVVLWVRDVTRDTAYQNNPVLVSVHTRTGFIAVHPVDTSNSPTSDFNFTLDGRLSGL